MAERGKRRGWRSVGWGLGTVLAAAVLGPCVFYVGYVAVNAINCPEAYDPDVADFCGWRPPDKDAAIVPPGWSVVANTDDLACGSGGCIDRVWVMEAPDTVEDPVPAYAAAAEDAGWATEEVGNAVYLKSDAVCLRLVASSDVEEWKRYTVAEYVDTETDRRVMVVGNLVNGGARWDWPRPPTTGPLEQQCAISL